MPSKRNVLQALQCGWRLRCPRCQTGRLYDGYRQQLSCPRCGLPFRQAEEGDFLVTIVMVYGLAAVIVGALVIAFNVLKLPLNVTWQIVVCLVVGLGVPMTFYRRFKGLTAAILYVTFGAHSE